MISFVYWIGVLTSLTIKLGNDVIGHPTITWPSRVQAWFFGTGENSIKSVTYIAVAWVFGEWYIGNIYWSEPQTIFPIHSAIALLLGSLVEFVVPFFTEKFISMLKQGFGK